MLLAGAIFVLTIVLVIWQPKGLGIGWSAAFGAALALATGGVQVADIPVVWHIVWNATATFIAVIIISLLLDESGFFEWAALHVSRWGKACNVSGRQISSVEIASGDASVNGASSSSSTNSLVVRYSSISRFLAARYSQARGFSILQKLSE